MNLDKWSRFMNEVRVGAKQLVRLRRKRFAAQRWTLAASRPVVFVASQKRDVDGSVAATQDTYWSYTIGLITPASIQRTFDTAARCYLPLLGPLSSLLSTLARSGTSHGGSVATRPI